MEKLLDKPTENGWWYSVGKYRIRMCYVWLDKDTYTYIGAELPDHYRCLSIQEGLQWLQMTRLESEALTSKGFPGRECLPTR